MSIPSQIWNDADRETCFRMWAAGSSGNEIANTVGRTRNAVIALVRRHRLTRDAGIAHGEHFRVPHKRGPKGSGKGKSRARKSPIKAPKFVANQLPLRVAALNDVAPLPYVNGWRDPHGCAYLAGEPSTAADKGFCNRPVHPGTAWCPAHYKLCYSGG